MPYQIRGEPARARRACATAAAAFVLAGLLTILSPAAPAAAQGSQINVIAGATFSSLRGIDGFDSRTGFMAGLSFVRPIAIGFAIQPEALFVSRGASAGSSIRESVSLTQFEVPLLLRMNLGTGLLVTPHVYAGPYFGVNISCTVEDQTSVSCGDFPEINTSTIDVGGILGGGASVGAGPLLVSGGLRYGFGISTLAEFERDQVRESAKNGAFSIYLSAGIRTGGR